MSNDWKKTLSAIAPTIATALGGPMAGMAINLAAKALGVDPSEDNISNAVLTGSPDTLLKLKSAEHQFKADMKKLDVDLEKIHSSDRDSARKMAVDTSITPQVVLASIFVLGYILVLYNIFKGDVEISEKMMEMSMFLLGILSAGIAQIMNFFFGSSSGSKQKTNIMGAKLNG